MTPSYWAKTGGLCYCGHVVRGILSSHPSCVVVAGNQEQLGNDDQGEDNCHQPAQIILQPRLSARTDVFIPNTDTAMCMSTAARRMAIALGAQITILFRSMWEVESDIYLTYPSANLFSVPSMLSFVTPAHFAKHMGPMWAPGGFHVVKGTNLECTTQVVCYVIY
jgi:hypothetical protein